MRDPNPRLPSQKPASVAKLRRVSLCLWGNRATNEQTGLYGTGHLMSARGKRRAAFDTKSGIPNERGSRLSQGSYGLRRVGTQRATAGVSPRIIEAGQISEHLETGSEVARKSSVKAPAHSQPTRVAGIDVSPATEIRSETTMPSPASSTSESSKDRDCKIGASRLGVRRQLSRRMASPTCNAVCDMDCRSGLGPINVF